MIRPWAAASRTPHGAGYAGRAPARSLTHPPSRRPGSYQGLGAGSAMPKPRQLTGHNSQAGPILRHHPIQVRRLRARIQRFTGAYRSVSGIRRSRRLRIVIHDGPGNECPVAASRYVAPRVCAAEPGSAQRRPGTRPAVTYCGLMYPCLPEPIAEREAQAVCGSVYPPMTSMAATRPTDVQLAAVWKVPAQRSVVGPASTVLAPLHRDRNRSLAGLPPDLDNGVWPHSEASRRSGSRGHEDKTPGQGNFQWGERGDSNPRHPGPQPGALTN